MNLKKNLLLNGKLSNEMLKEKTIENVSRNIVKTEQLSCFILSSESTNQLRT